MGPSVASAYRAVTALSLLKTENLKNHSLDNYKFLQPANLTTYTTLSLFSLHVELAPHLLSP